MQTTFGKIKLAIYVIVAIAVIVTIYAVINAINRSNKIATTVTFFPTTATVTANDIKLTSGKTAYLLPGTYTIEAKAEGFSSFTQNMTVDSSRHSIALILRPESDDAKAYAKDHQKDYTTAEGAVGTQSRQNATVIFDKNSIIKHLPVVDKYFSIGYVSADGENITVTVNTVSPQYRYAAIKQIQNWGYDPTDLSIRFTNYHNPLTPLTDGDAH